MKLWYLDDYKSVLESFVRSTWLDGVSDSECFVVDFHKQYNPYFGREEYLITLYQSLNDSRCQVKCWFDHSELKYKRIF